MPTPDAFPLVTLGVAATQSGASSAPGFVSLVPPPLLLIHGIWSSASAAGFSPFPASGFWSWIFERYPHTQIYPVNYDMTLGTINQNSLAFNDSGTQRQLLYRMTDALDGAAAAGIAARTVDVVAHSMGGLVTRYFVTHGPPLPSSELLPNPVHKLITIGTPHQGTPLATLLEMKQGNVAMSVTVGLACQSYSIPPPCTLAKLFASMGKIVDTGAATSGVASLEPTYPPLLALGGSYSSIVGQAPLPSPSLPAGSLTQAFLKCLN